MSITLFTKNTGGSQETFNDSKKDLKAEATFQKAVVTTGTWILYTYANYNGAQAGGSPSNHKVLKEGHEADITSVNGSMYLVENATEGFILFDHCYYGGARRYFNENCPDVKKAFPGISGISSAINLSHDEEFQIFNKPGYEGLQGKLERNKWYPTPSGMGLRNDTMQSIRKE